jgi:hypothetical protein
MAQYCCGLDGPDTVPGRSRNLDTVACKPALGPTQLPIQWVLGVLFPQAKWPGHKADSSPASGADISTVMLYLHSQAHWQLLTFTSQAAWNLDQEYRRAMSILSSQNNIIIHWVHDHLEYKAQMQMLLLRRDQIIYCLEIAFSPFVG